MYDRTKYWLEEKQKKLRLKKKQQAAVALSELKFQPNLQKSQKS